jgi:ArsR family transcriptional regulator
MSRGKALADPARLKILEFLRKPDSQCCTFADRVCACDIESHLGLSQPATSHRRGWPVVPGW